MGAALDVFLRRLPGVGQMPTPYRCSGCGNRTRFDVTTRRRTLAYHHFSLSGELTVENEKVLAEEIEEVACRWCGSAREVEQLDERGERAQA